MLHHHLTTRATLILSWIAFARPALQTLPYSACSLLSDPGYYPHTTTESDRSSHPLTTPSSDLTEHALTEHALTLPPTVWLAFTLHNRTEPCWHGKLRWARSARFGSVRPAFTLQGETEPNRAGTVKNASVNGVLVSQAINHSNIKKTDNTTHNQIHTHLSNRETQDHNKGKDRPINSKK